MDGVLIHADTVRSATLRHEVPLAIIDEFTYLEAGGRRVAVISSLEADRVAEAAPDIDVVDPHDLGWDELLAQGLNWDEANIELALRACRRLGLTRLRVPATTGVALADRLRAEGIEVVVDGAEFERRRRAKNELEVAGVLRAQAAATGAMGIAAALLRQATDVDGLLHVDGAPLTAERVREAMRGHAAAQGCPMPGDVSVAPGAAGASGHEPGTGPLPAGVPIVIDIWPQDEPSACWADMTRTFVAGAPPADDVVEMHRLCLEALENVKAAARPGVTGLELYGIACDVFEAAGHPTQRTKREGETLRDGFYHSLGHGVGLAVHEYPSLGRSGNEPLVPGDVIAVEPGSYRQGYGGVRLEDLLLITRDGCEVLADFPYDLVP
ncbi:MAG: M24 family metallopeptidase [Thermoleophilia bacterium]